MSTKEKRTRLFHKSLTSLLPNPSHCASSHPALQMASSPKSTNTAPSALAGARELFNSLDVDHDGQLTRTELAEAMRALDSSISADQIAAAFGTLDTDGSGAVSFEEFARGYALLGAGAGAGHHPAPAAGAAVAAASSPAPVPAPLTMSSPLAAGTGSPKLRATKRLSLTVPRGSGHARGGSGVFDAKQVNAKVDEVRHGARGGPPRLCHLWPCSPVDSHPPPRHLRGPVCR
jgi:hypothetical protein